MQSNTEDKSIWSVYKLALAAKILLEDGKKKNVHLVHVEAVQEKPPVDDVDIEEFDNKIHFEAINVLQAQRGLPP